MYRVRRGRDGDRDRARADAEECRRARLAQDPKVVDRALRTDHDVTKPLAGDLNG